jgi:hypothetical protein
VTFLHACDTPVLSTGQSFTFISSELTSHFMISVSLLVTGRTENTLSGSVQQSNLFWSIPVAPDNNAFTWASISLLHPSGLDSVATSLQ